MFLARYILRSVNFDQGYVRKNFKVRENQEIRDVTSVILLHLVNNRFVFSQKLSAI